MKLIASLLNRLWFGQVHPHSHHMQSKHSVWYQNPVSKEVWEILLELSTQSLTDEEKCLEVGARYRLLEEKLGGYWLANVAGGIPQDLLRSRIAHEVERLDNHLVGRLAIHILSDQQRQGLPVIPGQVLLPNLPHWNTIEYQLSVVEAVCDNDKPQEYPNTKIAQEQNHQLLKPKHPLRGVYNGEIPMSTPNEQNQLRDKLEIDLECCILYLKLKRGKK